MCFSEKAINANNTKTVATNNFIFNFFNQLLKSTSKLKTLTLKSVVFGIAFELTFFLKLIKAIELIYEKQN